MIFEVKQFSHLGHRHRTQVLLLHAVFGPDPHDLLQQPLIRPIRHQFFITPYKCNDLRESYHTSDQENIKFLIFIKGTLKILQVQRQENKEKEKKKNKIKEKAIQEKK